MKIAVIGANGNLGTRVTRQALDRGIEVKGIVHKGVLSDARAELLEGSLFDISGDAITDCDAIVSAYGSGFKADPVLNYKAFMKYIELCKGTGRHLIAIGGAGSLYTDETHERYCYEETGYSKTLYGISLNIKMGIDELRKTKDVNWTVVCPSQFFDPEGGFTGDYLISAEGHLIYNEDGESYVTYDDLAKAMIDIAEQNTYNKQQITVGSRLGKRS